MTRHLVAAALGLVAGLCWAQQQPASAPSTATADPIPSIADYVNVKRKLGMLPGRDVLFRNNSNQRLIVHLLDLKAGHEWKKVYMDAGQEQTAAFGSLWLAIQTGSDGSGEQLLAQLNTLALDRSGANVGTFFVRQFQSNERYELCWSNASGKWVLQELREALCH